MRADRPRGFQRWVLFNPQRPGAAHVWQQHFRHCCSYLNSCITSAYLPNQKHHIFWASHWEQLIGRTALTDRERTSDWQWMSGNREDFPDRRCSRPFAIEERETQRRRNLPSQRMPLLMSCHILKLVNYLHLLLLSRCHSKTLLRKNLEKVPPPTLSVFHTTSSLLRKTKIGEGMLNN